MSWTDELDAMMYCQRTQKMTNAKFLHHLASQRKIYDVDVARLKKIADKLIELDERDTVLTALENGGVNNWEWFEASLEDAGL